MKNDNEVLDDLHNFVESLNVELSDEEKEEINIFIERLAEKVQYFSEKIKNNNFDNFKKTIKNKLDEQVEDNVDNKKNT